MPDLKAVLDDATRKLEEGALVEARAQLLDYSAARSRGVTEPKDGDRRLTILYARFPRRPGSAA